MSPTGCPYRIRRNDPPTIPARATVACWQIGICRGVFFGRVHGVSDAELDMPMIVGINTIQHWKRDES